MDSISNIHSNSENVIAGKFSICDGDATEKMVIFVVFTLGVTSVCGNFYPNQAWLDLLVWLRRWLKCWDEKLRRTQ